MVSFSYFQLIRGGYRGKRQLFKNYIGLPESEIIIFKNGHSKLIKLKNILKRELEKEKLEIKGDVIETKKNGKRQNAAYKLLT